MAMGIWSWWAFDVFTLLASYLSTEIMSAQTCMRSLGLLTYMIPVGFATAGNILISKSIGERDEFMLKHYFRVAMGLSVCVAMFQVFMLLMFEESFMGIFTTKVLIVEQMKLAWPMFMIFVIFDTT
jgi:multidrug resistance protein, MATE family